MATTVPPGSPHRARALCAAWLVAAALAAHAAAPARAAERDLARQILDATGVRGGLVVHLGCGDGALTAALHASDCYRVHGLDTDPARVRQARDHIRTLGLYGPVAVDRFDGTRLPYAANLVNLVVAERLGGVARDEAMRVLAPGGVLYAKRDGRWAKSVKPRPANTDEWTHFLHDASGNPVAHDSVVGPPRRVQWIAQPRHARSHEHTPTIFALVSTGGRIFYVADRSPTGSLRRLPEWHLTARDAYNGLLLWQRPIAQWFSHLCGWTQQPRQLQRKLVAVGERVYVTLGYHASLSALDAATGKTVRVYDNTQGTEEILCHKGVLVLAVRAVTDERVAEFKQWAQLAHQKKSPLDTRESILPLLKRFRGIEAKAPRSIVALDAETGRVLWTKTGAEAAARPNTLCAVGDRVIYQKGRDVVCLELRSGRQQWATPAPTLRVVGGGKAVCAGGDNIAAISIDTGKTAWTQKPLLCSIRDAFVIKGTLWLGGFKPYQGRRKGRRGPAWGPYFATQRDLATGKLLKHLEPENPGHHHRCWQNKATDRYIIAGRRGAEFIDLASGDVLWHSWVRGVCRYGVMPCNGLLYAPPHACGCYIAAKLTGFYALAPAVASGHRPVASETHLERGPAFGHSPATGHSPLATSSAWPTYRHDAERSGRAASPVPAAVRRRWQMKVGSRISSPTVAGGRVFVASVDDHRLCALDAETGRPAWSFTAGARVDSPPTLHGGQALFGSHDGCVYSLRATDGALAWRLTLAGAERRVAAWGQLESALPVHGSVLVHGGAAYFVAGRSSYLDGGLRLCRVDPATGKVLSTTPLYSPDPKTGRQPKQFGPAYMPGALSDILSADAQHVYLRDAVFDKQGAPKPKGNPHLFTLTGFLDDTWPHRSYWIFGTKCSLATGCSGRDRNLLYGRLLAVDAASLYGYGRKRVHWSNALEDGAYRLFALDRAERKERWSRPIGMRVRAMVLAGKVLFVAGPPAAAVNAPEPPPPDLGAVVLALSTADGSELGRCKLDASPVFDGMAAAGGRLYLCLANGTVACLEGR